MFKEAQRFVNSTAYIDFKFRVFRHMGYTPSEGQALFHRSFCRFRALTGGARLGKSLLAGAEAAVALLVPGARIWLVGPQYALSEKEFDWTCTLLAKIKLKVLGGQSVLDVCRVSQTSKGSKRIVAPWGSWLETKSVDRPKSLLGESLSLAVLCEAAMISLDAYQRYVRARLGDLLGNVIATSTPDQNSGLLWMFYKRGQEKEQLDRDWET